MLFSSLIGPSEFWDRFSQLTLDALPHAVTVTNGASVILGVNQAWRNLTESNGGAGYHYWVGHNYLSLCERAEGEHAPIAREAAHGIRAVLDGTRALYSQIYPFDSPETRQWFLLCASSFEFSGNLYGVFAHLVVTEWMSNGSEPLFRQPAALPVPQAPATPPVSEAVGDLRLDRGRGLLWVKENPVQLSPIETALLGFLMRHPNQAFSSRVLLEKVWGLPPGSGEPSLVRWHVGNIRRKIEEDPDHPVYLRTIPRYGYLLQTELPLGPP